MDQMDLVFWGALVTGFFFGYLTHNILSWWLSRWNDTEEDIPIDIVEEI